MEDIIKLLQAIAWPLVTLVGLLLLGPGGYLMRFAKALGESLSNFTVAIPVLRDTALRMRSDVEALTATANKVSSSFSEEYKALEERIDLLSKRLSDQLGEVREYINELDKSKLNEAQQSIEKAVDGDQQDAVPDTETSSELTPDEMMDSIKGEWLAFTDLLRGRFGKAENFDKRQIGFMAERLSHGKRTKPISKSDAAFIGELHSQYKRFTRLSSSRDEWMTPAIYSSFLAGVKKASESLR